MNKIITINLGGFAIPMQEDAFDLLREYLLKLEERFSGQAEGREIIDDIEARIGELLNVIIAKGYSSVNVSDIEKVKSEMGDPTEFSEVEGGESGMGLDQAKRRLYRDGEDKLLGGVCAGFGHYFGVDRTVIRLIWALLILFGGVGFLLYFILWFIIPEAKTRGEKMEMKGRAPTIENIKNNIKNESERFAEGIKYSAKDGRIRETAHEILDRIGPVFRFFGKLMAALFLMVGILLLVALTLLFVFKSDLFHLPQGDFFFKNLPLFENPALTIWLKGCLFFFFLIPVILLITALTKFLFNLKQNTRLFSRINWTLWILALIQAIGLVSYAAFDLKETVEIDKIENIHYRGDTLFLSLDKNFSFSDRNLYRRKVQFYLEKNHQKKTEMISTAYASGPNEITAEKRAKGVERGYVIDGNRVVLNKYLNQEVFQNQKLKITLRIPEGTFVSLDKNMGDFVRFSEIDNQNEAGNLFLMGSEGLKCVSCTGNSSNETYTGEGWEALSEPFTKVEIEDYFKVKIVRGDQYKVVISGTDNPEELVSVKRIGDRVKIQRKSWMNHLKHMGDKEDISILILCPNLRELEASGAGKIELRGLRGDFKADLAGAIKLEGYDLRFGRLDLEVSGASAVQLEGMADKLVLDQTGAVTVDAENLHSKEVSLDISGAGACFLNASERISGKAAGATKIEYKGNPDFKVDLQGAVQVKNKN